MSTCDPRYGLSIFYEQAGDFRAKCAAAGTPISAPPISFDALCDAWGALDGLDASSLVADTALPDTLPARPFECIEGDLGEAGDMLQCVNADFEHQRTTAALLADDARSCSEAIDDVMHTSCFSLVEVCEMGGSLLNMLTVLMSSSAMQGLGAAVAGAGAEIINQVLGMSKGMIADRDECIVAAFDAFALSCENHCETMEAGLPGVEKCLAPESVPEPVEPEPEPEPEPALEPVEPLPPPKKLAHLTQTAAEANEVNGGVPVEGRAGQW